MESWQEQKNLSDMLHIESLLGKLNKTEADPQLIPLDVKVTPLQGVPFEQTQTSTQAIPHQKFESFQILSKIYEIFLEDVSQSRDRLLHLNPSRRELIEHRLEFVARKLARSRGERLNRALSLTEILRETFRESNKPLHSSSAKLSSVAWVGFVTEVALYKILEIFFLNSLSINGWRKFEKSDLGRINFASHTFLTHRASGFAHDRHCWNFVRMNLYSWYSPTPTAIAKISELLEHPSLSRLSWSDLDLNNWIFEHLKADKSFFGHLDFESENRLASLTLDILENQMGEKLVNKFHSQAICKKFFIPALELGGVSLSILDRLLTEMKPQGLIDESSGIHRALWACETESFEAFWTEVMALLRTLRSFKNPAADLQQQGTVATDGSYCLYRLPHVMHVVHLNAPELHNLVQLPLGSPDVSKQQSGSAAVIQQYENFDVAVLTDHVDRTKSLKWMKAIADQLPYWSSHITSGTNLNWGEIHLYLALTKLRENGVCLYYSHRPFPEGGDAERLRKEILGISTLEYFVNFSANPIGSYQYLYIFRKNSNKEQRDKHKPFLGKLKIKPEHLNLRELEISNSSQLEIQEKGWDQLFIKGTAPLLWHLNHRFSKLSQLAVVQTFNTHQKTHAQELFSNPNEQVLEAELSSSNEDSSHSLRIRFQTTSVRELQDKANAKSEHFLVFPYNQSDIHWLQTLLNSSPVQFWIKQSILNQAQQGGKTKQLRMLDLKNCPILALSHPNPELFDEAVHWLTFSKPSAKALEEWACQKEESLVEKSAKFTALSRLYGDLRKIWSKYQPLFNDTDFTEFKPDAISYFYPSNYLCKMSQSQDIKAQYVDRHKTNLMPDNWTITGSTMMTSSKNFFPTPDNVTMTLLVLTTRQGPMVNIYVPHTMAEYLHVQINALKAYTWSEVLSMVRVPRDLQLFSVQVGEIKRVVLETKQKLQSIESVLNQLSCNLFELSDEFREMLK